MEDDSSVSNELSCWPLMLKGGNQCAKFFPFILEEIRKQESPYYDIFDVKPQV
jgi:hypothetical protein